MTHGARLPTCPTYRAHRERTQFESPAPQSPACPPSFSLDPAARRKVRPPTCPGDRPVWRCTI
eukprot:scaffold199460_cov27-Tisochrysis_lutea.AAC.4